MRQNFDVRGGPHIGRQNLPLLREQLKAQGLDGFFITHDDEYQNEYLPDANERLAWATGFSGSSGWAVVLLDKAAVFIDGRYTLQAQDQTDGALFERVDYPEPGPFGWIEKLDLSTKKIGYDPKVMSPNEVDRLARAVERSGATLIAVTENPIDAAWADRPQQPQAPIVPHPSELAGQSSEEKRKSIGSALADDDADAVLITSPASLAWLFNIRGGDVACSPLPLGRAILYTDGHADVFVDLAKESDGLRTHLGNEVTLHSMAALDNHLSALKGQTVSLDPAQASAWFFNELEGNGVVIKRQPDPVLLPKACKNDAEISGSKAAHKRDGVAVTRFLHWLDTEAQSGKVTEIDAALKLESFRDELGGLQDLSFETISGAGPNGALPHYRVSSASNRLLEPGSLYLVDSGGQYFDGTTDITRTVPIGQPSVDMKRHYTLVLKGHIALDRVRFPKGTTGAHLDVLARHALWQSGLDYDHGTGHGVGVYLGVHEGPQNISKALRPVPLEPGMIVSNEPGYYRVGEYGIRIENLQFVTPESNIEGGERSMLGFECLTLAPLARELIVLELISKEERDWVDAYHRRVLEEIGPLLDDAAANWLVTACEAL
ncbi:MAG: aminopeptidase P family protein [Pseudomonadota bacterium]